MPRSKGINLAHAWAETPTTGAKWQRPTNAERCQLINWDLRLMPLKCLDALSNGLVVLSITDSLSTAQRGSLLREVEQLLQLQEDTAVVVYLETATDKNALRRLRGVKVNDA